MNYTCEIVKDFNGLYYCNLFIDGEQVKDMPEYVSFEAITDAISAKIGVSPDKLRDVTFDRVGRKSYGYLDGTVDDEEYTIHNDKKTNMEYWDDIDSILEDTVEKIAKEYSTKKIDHLTLDVNITDITSEIREIVIKRLENIGGQFPYVDENY